jgi:hypothetical protein
MSVIFLLVNFKYVQITVSNTDITSSYFKKKLTNLLSCKYYTDKLTHFVHCLFSESGKAESFTSGKQSVGEKVSDESDNDESLLGKIKRKLFG